VVFIEAGEQGLVERWGKPRGEHILNPGLHLKMPWPMEQVYRYRTDEVQTFTIGLVEEEGDDGHGHGNKGHQQSGVVLWTVKHAKEEFNLLVASKDQLATTSTNQGGVPVDLLSVSIPVQFQIKDVKAFAYQNANSGELLEKLATREVIRYLVSVDIFDIMSVGRAKASQDLQELIQKRADDLNLGVRILFVGLQDIHPPTKVAPAYELVIGTRQENEAKLRVAEGYAARTVSLSAADAESRINKAESYRAQRVAGAQAQAAQFTNQLMAFKAAPEVYMNRAYLQAMARGTTNSRKYVVIATNTMESFQFNLEDRIRDDIGEIAVPKPK
jgi:HflK protein